MNRSEYLDMLSKRLARLPQSEINKTIDYYDEMICDRIEDGMSEEEAVQAIGDIEDIVQNIMYEQPLPNLIKASVSKKTDDESTNSGRKVLWIVLLALGSPVWLSLLAALFAVMIAGYTVIWSMTMVAYVLAGSFALTSIGCIVTGALAFINYPVPTAMCTVGAGFVLASLTLLVCLCLRPVTKLSVHLSKLGIHAVKSIFVK